MKIITHFCVMILTVLFHNGPGIHDLRYFFHENTSGQESCFSRYSFHENHENRLPHGLRLSARNRYLFYSFTSGRPGAGWPRTRYLFYSFTSGWPGAGWPRTRYLFYSFTSGRPGAGLPRTRYLFHSFASGRPPAASTGTVIFFMKIMKTPWRWKPCFCVMKIMKIMKTTCRTVYSFLPGSVMLFILPAPGPPSAGWARIRYFIHSASSEGFRAVPAEKPLLFS